MPSRPSPPADRALTLRRDCAAVGFEALHRLFCLAGLAGREAGKLQRAFENSSVVRFAYAGEQLVGAARALTDHEYHATIYDVAVHPSRQRQGIGTRLLRDLLADLAVWRILLVADAEAAPFYRRLGFGPIPDVQARFETRYLYDRAQPKVENSG